MIRVVVADDNATFRDWVVDALDLEEDLQVVGQASNGELAVETCLRDRPDVIVLDVEMPHMDGVEATRRIVSQCPSTRVVILTAYENDGLIMQLIQAGASGYLLKESKNNEFIRAIRVAHAGDSLIDPKVAQKMMRMMMGMAPASPTPTRHASLDKLEELTSREREVLREIGRGRNNKELADLFQIGVNTGKTHVARVMQKLDVRDRVELVLLAVQAGLVEEGA